MNTAQCLCEKNVTFVQQIGWNWTNPKLRRELACDMIVWAAVAKATLLNGTQFDLAQSDPAFPPFNAGYRDVAALTAPTWYPNPQKVGGIVDGDAKFQRFWNGTDWTAQARLRDGGRWTEHDLPLNSAPKT